MKTIKQWLNELPEPYRSQALENMNEFISNCPDHSIPDALLSAFDWDKSAEGHDYWSDLHDSLYDTPPN